MNISFKSNRLKKQLSSASEIKKGFGVNAKRVSQRIDEIEASPNLEVLILIPAAHCHPLRGKREGEWAVDISANHRLVFEIANDPVPRLNDGTIDTIKITDIGIIETIDYH